MQTPAEIRFRRLIWQRTIVTETLHNLSLDIENFKYQSGQIEQSLFQFDQKTFKSSYFCCCLLRSRITVYNVIITTETKQAVLIANTAFKGAQRIYFQYGYNFVHNNVQSKLLLTEYHNNRVFFRKNNFYTMFS